MTLLVDMTVVQKSMIAKALYLFGNALSSSLLAHVVPSTILQHMFLIPHFILMHASDCRL